MDGDVVGDAVGISVLVTDFNGDGIGDIILGAYGADPSGRTNAGSVYVVFGTASPRAANYRLNSGGSLINGTQGFRIDGNPANDNTGYSLATGEFNGDGVKDLLIGAPGFDSGSAGRAYVVFGSTGPRPLVIDNGTSGFTDGGGWSNYWQDGFCCGEYYAGTTATWQVTGLPSGTYEVAATWAPNGSWSSNTHFSVYDNATLRGGANANQQVAGSDFTFSRMGWKNIGSFSITSGTLKVVLDSSSGGSAVADAVYIKKQGGWGGTWPVTMDLLRIDGENGAKFANQEFWGCGMGTSVAAGDLNGDGKDDAIFACSTYNGNKVYVVFGMTGDWNYYYTGGGWDHWGTGGNTNLWSNQQPVDGTRVASLYHSYYHSCCSGTSLATGDVNGDGKADILYGMPAINSSTGTVYAVFGKSSWAANTDIASMADGSNGFKLEGIAAGDKAGNSLAARDVNADGKADILIGAPGVSGKGAAYLVFGKPSQAPYVPRSATIIDNGGSGHASTGSWSSYCPGASFNVYGSCDIYSSDSSATSTWTATGLAAGDYKVAVIYNAWSDHPVNAPFKVYDNASLLGTVTADQTADPSDFTENGYVWKNLGTYTISSGTLKVKLDYTGITPGKNMVADAVRFISVADEAYNNTYGPKVIDNGGAGFATAGSWNTASPSSTEVYGSNQLYTAAGAGTTTATWTFSSLTPGTYTVAVSYNAWGTHATNAPWNVYDNNTLLGTVSANEQVTPSDMSYNGTVFKVLGTYTISSTTLKVQTNNSANGEVIADAVYIRYYTPCVGCFSASTSLSGIADGTNGVRFDGAVAGDQAGTCVAFGDVDNNTKLDILIGAYGVDPHGSASGSTYGYYGKGSGTWPSTFGLSGL